MDPSVVCNVYHGLYPTLELIDEPGVLVQSLTISATREKSEFKGGNNCVKGVRYSNPILNFAFRGYISEVTGLADEHPGSIVTNLLNYTDNIHGFDPDDGVLIYEDPSREQTTDQPAQVSFTVVQYPFIEAA